MADTNDPTQRKPTKAERIHVTRSQYCYAVNALLAVSKNADVRNILLALNKPRIFPLDLSVLAKLDDDQRFNSLIAIRGYTVHQIPAARLVSCWRESFERLEREQNNSGRPTP